jgi:hypothetical protein
MRVFRFSYNAAFGAKPTPTHIIAKQERFE